MKPKIKYINHSIGYYTSDGIIELNHNLKNYPELHKMVLSHEIGHSKSGNKHIDFIYDLKDSFNFKKQWMFLKFTLRNPRALLSISPIFFEKRGVSFNWFMVLFWISLLIIGGVIIL